MILFIIIILIAVGFYVLGAKNGLPKFGFETSQKKLNERIEFLSELKEGDVVTTYKFGDDSSFEYDFNRTYTVIKNDPENEKIFLKEYQFQEPDIRSYDCPWFKGVIEKNDNLLKAIIRRNKQKNERKEENND